MLFYGQALAISSVVGWSLMAVALKKYTFYDYFVPSKEAGNTILKAMALLQSQVNLKEPVGRIYIFKEGRNERKKDDHNDDMCVCVF